MRIASSRRSGSTAAVSSTTFVVRRPVNHSQRFVSVAAAGDHLDVQLEPEQLTSEPRAAVHGVRRNGRSPQ